MVNGPSSVLALGTRVINETIVKGYSATHTSTYTGLIIFGSLCAAAGIGGGGIIVSVLMNFGELSPHDAVLLSKAIVFFGSVCSLILNLGKRSLSSKDQDTTETAPEPLINWHIAKIIVPMALVGTLLGVM